MGGLIGLVCMFIISLDKQKLLENPSFRPICDLNPVVSCGSVMKSWQGSVFGFPNPWIGLAAFSATITIGMALLSGAKFKRWFWLGFETGVVFGLAFAYWLLFQSVYRIRALCPYCLASDVVVITIFWYVSLYLVDLGLLAVPARLKPVADYARKHHLDLLILWFVVLIGVILKHFWYYYSRHLF